MDDGFTKQELGIVNPFLFMTPTVSIASKTKFPSKVRHLDRASLEATYLGMRESYKSLMISRGKHRSQSVKIRAAMDVLEERLRSIAEREASVRAEAYEMLEIVTNVIGELEDAGDDLVTEFNAYQAGASKVMQEEWDQGVLEFE